MQVLQQPRRLYLRLYLSFLGVLLAVVLVAAAISLLLGRGGLAFWRQGPRVAGHIGRVLPTGDDRLELSRGAQTLHDELGFDIAIFGPRGELLASAGQPISIADPHLLERARREPGWLPGPGLVGGRLRGHTGAVFIARLPLPESARDRIVRPLLLLAGTLLVSLALIYPLARSITRPLERLTASVEAFGKGELSARSGIAQADEVGRLARSFDEMAGRIQATRRAEKELLANVSHELRTPLARIRVALELIGPRDAALERRLSVVGGELDELEQLISDVLTASKLDLAAQPLQKRTLALADLVEKSRKRALTLAPQQPITANLSAGLTLLADEALLSRALDNLLDNARKYAAGQRPIEVEARPDGSHLVLAVRDHGPGIPPDELERVFDPFFRGSGARGTQGGFGLGLALARRVAEAHGGSIRASNAEGGGARIELRLPG